ncbi:transcriptional regulator [Geothrix limicola]|uniref:Transcriptional regulator n=1 Tax=Geothrix limicola TaxID=2927978 RepID=A0ABQ5QGK7_9BACT|nr:SIS domain-containing protein [Geothrix limicola]GLH73295.1 transcriptional regulator [Geothrix limicola]
MSLLSRIQALLPDLPPSEKRVAELVLNRPVEVVSAPISQIAQWSDVSQPTVIRFCRRLKCPGLPGFKLKLAGDLGAGIPFVHASLAPGDDLSQLIGKVFDHAVAGLARGRNALPPEAVDRAVEALDRASRIECYGLGNSAITAQDAQMKLFRLGTATVVCTDSQIQRVAAALLPGDAAVLVISNSGRTKSLLDVAALARRSGATIIALTRSDSPLAEAADILLPADVQENPEVYAPMVSRLVHLAIIDVLTVALALRKGPAAITRMEVAKASLQATREPR